MPSPTLADPDQRCGTPDESSDSLRDCPLLEPRRRAFIAAVFELPGCVADGATYQEVLATVEVVIREWIETARELGRPVPESRGRLQYT